jgi:hypothetical protein
MSRLRIIAASLASLLLIGFGCKKEEDEKAPIPVTIVAPASGSSLRILEDTVRIMLTAKVPDDGPASIRIYLKYESSGSLAAPPITYYEANTRNTLEYNYTVSDSLLSGGTYRLEVQVVTPDNSGKADIPIELIAVPRRLIGTLLLTRPDSTRTRLWLADASLNLTLFREMSGDYVGSDLQNSSGTFLIARRTNASTFFKISDGTVLRTVTGEQAAPVPSFSGADFQEGLHFLSFYQSSIRGYDGNGIEQFRTASQPLDYDFRKWLRFGNYLYAYAHLDLPATEKLFVINYPSGYSRSECNLDLQVSGILPADGEDVFLFGTRSDGALSIVRYYLSTNSANEQLARTGLQLREVIPGPGGVGARLLTDRGIYRFDPATLGLQQESSRTGQRFLRDTEGQRLYLVDSTTVNILAEPDLSDIGSLTSPEPVKNVIDWYNR